MTESTTERERAIRAIETAKEVVEIQAVLLKICRRHERAALATSQGRNASEQLMKQVAVLKEKAVATFASRGLSPATRDFAKETLEQASDLVVTARALALGIDLAMQTHYKAAYPAVYQQLCARNPVRRLKKGDPYPTPLVDLAPMYGGKHGLSRKRNSNAGTAFDRVDGLALWRSPLRAIYDTEAGNRLNAALGKTVTLLAVSPNHSSSDFDFYSGLKPNKFFNVGVFNTQLQDKALEGTLRIPEAKRADIVVTPELSSTGQTLNVIKQNTADGRPPIVIAGGAHVTIRGKQLNRLSTIYTGPSPHVVNHDKIGEYVFAKTFKEDIDRSTQLCIHAGTNWPYWSMVPLICADLLEAAVVDAVGDLCPRLVVVPSMSIKTGDFEDSMGAVITKSQALIVVVNGPHEWKDPQTGTSKKARIVVVGMPLLESGRRRLSPRPSDKPPYKVLISSKTRSLRSVR